MNGNKTDVILRIKKTINYIDKILENYPKSEIVLKKRIGNSIYDILEYCYMAISDVDNKNKYIKCSLVKMKMLDFYLKCSFDKNIISHKNIKTLGINLREITSILNAWERKNEKIK